VEIKDKQVIYHDWESAHYDDKWSISFDERCIEYAAGRIRKILPDDTDLGTVLEIGCGTGFFLLNLWQAGFVAEAHGSDISEGMVAMFVENGRRLGIDVHGQVADAEALPYEDACFDTVIGHAVVHHLPDLETAFGEFRRILRPGGRLIIAGEPTRTGDRIANQFKRAARIGVKLAAVVAGADRVLASGNGHLSHDEREAAGLEWDVDLHCFPPQELEALAARAGFIGVRSVTEELTANWFGWTTRTVEAMVGVDRLPDGYRWWAYRVWHRLSDFDDRIATRFVPKGVFYNCILTATTPTDPMPAAAP
jgi:SAM-dependent methyltransferase